MEENQRSLAKDKSLEEKIKEAIKVAILQDKELIVLDDGKSRVNISIIREKSNNNRYNIRVGNKNLVTAIENNNTISFENLELDLNQLEKAFNLKETQIRIEQEGQEENSIKRKIEKGQTQSEISKTDSTNQRALEEEMKQKIQSGEAKEIEIDREMSYNENTLQFVQRAFGIKNMQSLYRVRGKDTHDFKYVAKTSDKENPYKEIDLSTKREGRNTNQHVWLMHNGEIKEKKVDSLLTMSSGNYAIATDIPEGVGTDNVRTYLTVRTPSGEYFAIEASEKNGVNRNTSGDSLQKKLMSKGKSIYEIEDVIKAARLASRIYTINKDGKLTTREVNLVNKLREDNLPEEAIDNVIDCICMLKEMGFEPMEVKEMIDKIPKTEKDFKMLEEKLEKAKEGDEQEIHTHDDHSERNGSKTLK